MTVAKNRLIETPEMDRMKESIDAAVSRVRTLAAGLLVSGTVAMAAMFLASHYQAPVMLFALLLGLAFAFLYQDGDRCVEGIQFASSTVLRIGVALLGVRLTFEQVAAFGWLPVILVSVSVLATIAFGLVVARPLGQRAQLGLVSAGAVAICGASAALALSSVLPRHERLESDTVLVVVGVTTLSTVAMVIYPIIPVSLGFDDTTAGYFLGATIHDVAQVVGAGYSISEETGDVSTFVKMLRVSMLVPVVFGVILFLRARGMTGKTKGFPLPPFLIVFAGLVVVNSAGWLTTGVVETVSDISRWCLVTAIAALGMKTSLGSLLSVGVRPITLIVGETLFIMALILVGLFLAGV